MEQINQEDKIVEIIDKLEENLNLEDESEDENEDEEFEFSFFGHDLESPVSADEVFHNGQIRTIFPLFGENVEISGGSSEGAYPPPARKVFVAAAEDDNVAEVSYCEWSTEKSTPENSSPWPEMSRKSNSTGFSRLWRVKDLLARSNSDGKDTFVFLARKGTNKATTMKVMKTEVTADVAVENKKMGKKPTKTAAGAAYEALYGKKKGGGKTYLPYRQELVGGFFTNVNGMTRNIHPY